MSIDYNTFHKIVKNKDGEDVKLVLNHVDNKDCKAYLCKAKENHRNNSDTIEIGKYYICYFPPTVSITRSSMNWSKQGYFGMGAIEHTFSFEHNNFTEVNIYNSGKYMRKNQTKFCTVPVECIEIIGECKYEK